MGENSSGKSTFLAALAAVSDSTSFPGASIFNKPPYDLGTFDTIATYKGGRSGRAKSFSLGYKDPFLHATGVKVFASFTSDDGEARLSRLKFEQDEVQAQITWENSSEGTITIGGLEGLEGRSISRKFHEGLATSSLQQLAVMMGLHLVRNDVSTGSFSRKLSAKIYDQLWHYTEKWGKSSPKAVSIAPIRSEPKRTYDQSSNEYDPSGDHIPYVLARILQKEDKKNTAPLHSALIEFGKESGLFKDLDVKRLGSKVSDPFQVRMNVGGPSVNLSDVGYGVSQSLPIIVESILRTGDARLLLQQPEVHLHPRAQAALGSFFTRLVSKQQRNFVVETHSDYLIDRVRQEIALGRISKDMVNILFFDRSRLETKVSMLTLDDYGNIKDAPPNYRAFFLEEEFKLLSRVG